MEREIRPMDAEVRASPGAAGERRFEGYAARFNSPSVNMGGVVEDIAPGAFAETLDGDVRALFNHDPNYVLGRTSAGTLTLSEDENGLRFEISAPDTAWARDLHASVQRGDINQCSFAFETMEDEWQRGAPGEPDRRTLKKVRLLDVSIVTYPAYQATSVSARSCASAPNDMRRKRLRLKEKER